jgi:Zn-finger nucleic acid-binding protein
MTTGTVACPQCGAPMAPDENRNYLHCTYCGNYYIPDPNQEGVSLLGEATRLKCPMCCTSLATAVVNDARILACPKCHGNLIPQSQLQSIIKAASPVDSDLARFNRPPDMTELKRKLACPACQRTMETYAYGGGGAVIIQGCGACQVIWLDFGELAKIIWAVQNTQAIDRDKHDPREDDFDARSIHI